MLDLAVITAGLARNRVADQFGRQARRRGAIL
jgi:hypothetical protein